MKFLSKIYEAPQVELENINVNLLCQSAEGSIDGIVEEDVNDLWS